MKRRSKRGMTSGIMVLAALILCGLGMQQVHAQDLVINTRPLTTQEIADHGMSEDTQLANGTHVVGIGQPIYLDLLIDKDEIDDGVVVTQVVWTIDAVLDDLNLPITDSEATLDDSPLPESLPTYNSVDRATYDILDRAMIVPDKRGTYQISVQAMTESNGVYNASIEVVGSAFIGKDSQACSLCHESKMEPFDMTHHAVAFEYEITGEGSGHFQEFCIQCHATGYDTAPAAVNGGFDDIADAVGWEFPDTLSPTNWTDMPEELKNLANVTCESCHGPAQEHLRTGGDTSKIGMTVSAGNCGQCHDAVAHHVKNFEWGTSVHGQTEVDRGGSCANCHTTAGFIDDKDPGMNEDGEFVAVNATFKEGITCAACHDPHGPGQGVHQIRAITSSELGNGVVVDMGGKGLICMNCHKSRRDAATYVDGRLSTHFGPHHGPQTDMLMGENAYEYKAEYNLDMPSSAHGSVVEDACVQCHMQETPGDVPAYAENRVGGHSFAPSFYDMDGMNDPVHLTEACASCHGDIEDFDFGGADYDLDGVVEGVQTEIADMLHDLGMLLPPVGDPHIGLHDSTDGYDTPEYRRAVYNYLFVEEDGSHGVHNPKYAAAILRASIDDLKGGIDVDRDGLVDSWEVAYFGNITSQSGDDDYDGDGLNNAQEQNIGTDPLLADSDGDTYSDLVEVQAGSDPWDIDSVPSSDMILMDAVEVGYLPQVTGSVVRIQSIDTLSGGGWQDLGSAQTNAGGWVFEFDSLLGTTNRFYRAIEE